MNRRKFIGRIGLSTGALLILQPGCADTRKPKASAGEHIAVSASDPMADSFATPTFDCGPWVYWFWLDVNVTRAGITADLEAMKAVGIAGVLIMDVDQGTPASFNGAKFGDAKWYDLFHFACAEAHRLGIKVNMTNDAGWCGSAGPWITPELSMQRVVWSRSIITGGNPSDTVVPMPAAQMDYYRDITVVAFPTPTSSYTLANLENETDVNTQDNQPAPAQWPTLQPGAAVPATLVLDLSQHMDKNGRLVWNPPPGKWTILRFGHTTTGVLNHPAPNGGLGLETDKLSRRATLLQFESLMSRIARNLGPLAGSTLVTTHIDSWETGSQNWTLTFREDFLRLRGYDLLPYLPVFAGQVIESQEISERFLWDLRKTVGDLLVQNYATAMREMAHKHGLKLSIEAYYGEPASNLRYGGVADEPMAECWAWPRFSANDSVTEMTNAGQVYGHNIIGQETFTSDSNEKWLGHPAVVKDIGDWTFAEGINRFVFHRYAMQPWTNPHYAPGVSMGPWGLHYERTQTWWHLSKPWHDYVARCCYLLRQGQVVADICYLQPEGEPQQFTPPDDGLGHPSRRPGYNYHACPAELVRDHMEFTDGFLTLPNGLKYRVLVLPDSPTMTLALLKKIAALVEAGAWVMGPRPQKSPSLADYPDGDAEIQRIAATLWDTGKITTGKTAAEALAGWEVTPDFVCDQPMVRWLHRRVEDRDIYFVANGAAAGDYPHAGFPMVANCSFHVTGSTPEIWDPETGRISTVTLYNTGNDMTHIPLVLSPKKSVFVIFRQGQMCAPNQIVKSVSLQDKTLMTVGSQIARPQVQILSATYGVPGDADHARDVAAIIQKLIDAGGTTFPVVKIAALGGDPDFGVVKTLDVNYRSRDKEIHNQWHDGDTVDFSTYGDIPPVTVEMSPDGGLKLFTTQPGNYLCELASGKVVKMNMHRILPPILLEGPWRVQFPEGWGAPAQIDLEKLIALNLHSDAGVRYFSGTASYAINFDVAEKWLKGEHRIELDLGEVAVMAKVTLNGQPMGILWKSPFCLDVTTALKIGTNTLEIDVANLWVNRLIGDQQLPADAERADDGHLTKWPEWLLAGKRSPTGRFTFTTWELWHKNDPLVASGLIGPVQLRLVAGKEIDIS